jgi:hypothetical protein
MVVHPTVLAQDEEMSSPEDQARTLTVLESTDIFSASDEFLWTAEPGEIYTVAAVEGDMALIITDNETGELAWIQIDARVAVEEITSAEEIEDIEPTAIPSPVVPPTVMTPAAMPTLTQTPVTVVQGTQTPGVGGLVTPTPGPPVAQTPGPPGARNPASWSLTPADLPGFVLETPLVPPAPGFTGHAAFLVNTQATPEQRAPLVVINILIPADPTAPNVTQAMMDDLAIASVQGFAAGGAFGRTMGPTVGEVSSWGRATSAQSDGSVTTRFEVNVVAFTVRRDVAIVSVINTEGTADQAEIARLANIVAERMRS